MASEGCGAFSTLPLSPPFSFAFQTLASYILLPSSAFSLSPYPRVLCVSVVIFPFLSAQSVKLVLVKTRICGFLLLTIIHQKQPFYPLTCPPHLNLNLLIFSLFQPH